MKYAISLVFFTLACYFLDKHGIGLIKTPFDFIAIVACFCIGNTVLQIME